MAMVQGDAVDTPLQEALAVLAAAIGKVGLAVGVVCFIVLLVRYLPVLHVLMLCLSAGSM